MYERTIAQGVGFDERSPDKSWAAGLIYILELSPMMMAGYQGNPIIKSSKAPNVLPGHQDRW